MKNLIIVFLFALIPSALVFGQDHKYECEADCFFTKCKIKCSPDQGGALCTCAWGFASCACGGNIDAAIEIDHVAVYNYSLELQELGLNEMSTLVSAISTQSKEGKDTRDLIEAYIKKADRLSGSQRQQVLNLTRSNH